MDIAFTSVLLLRIWALKADQTGGSIMFGNLDVLNVCPDSICATSFLIGKSIYETSGASEIKFALYICCLSYV